MRYRSLRIQPTVHPPEPANGRAAAVLAASGLGVLGLILASDLLGRSHSPLMWYLTRASAVTLYALLWLTVVTGLGITTGALDRYGGRGIIYSLHAYATQLSYGFLALHVITLVANPNNGYSARMIFVPFAAGWHEPWTGVGVIAAYLLVVVGASFSIRRLTGYRPWRWLHALSFPLYGLALAHSLGSGTDSGSIWVRGIYILSVAPILWLTLVRLAGGGRRKTLEMPISGPRYDRLSRSSTSPSRSRGNELIPR